MNDVKFTGTLTTNELHIGAAGGDVVIRNAKSVLVDKGTEVRYREPAEQKDITGMSFTGTLDLSNDHRDGEKEIPYWPYCPKCERPYAFDEDEPFAHCGCGISEWGYPRPAPYVKDPSKFPEDKCCGDFDNCKKPCAPRAEHWKTMCNNIGFGLIKAYAEDQIATGMPETPFEEDMRKQATIAVGLPPEIIGNSSDSLEAEEPVTPVHHPLPYSFAEKGPKDNLEPEASEANLGSLGTEEAMTQTDPDPITLAELMVMYGSGIHLDRYCGDPLTDQPAPDIAMMRATSEEEILRLLKENGMSLFYVRAKTDLYVKTAIEQNGHAIQYVPNRLMTLENARMAVQQNPMALRWIKNQTDSLCEFAVYLEPTALRWCSIQTPSIVETALSKNVKAVQYVWEKDMLPEWFTTRYTELLAERFANQV